VPKAWRLRIAEIKDVYFVCDTEQEARELLGAGNEPEIEDLVELMVSERAVQSFIQGLGDEPELEAAGG